MKQSSDCLKDIIKIKECKEYKGERYLENINPKCKFAALAISTQLCDWISHWGVGFLFFEDFILLESPVEVQADAPEIEMRFYYRGVYNTSTEREDLVAWKLRAEAEGDFTIN